MWWTYSEETSMAVMAEGILRNTSFPVPSVLGPQMILAKPSGTVCYTKHLCVSMFGGKRMGSVHVWGGGNEESGSHS